MRIQMTPASAVAKSASEIKLPSEIVYVADFRYTGTHTCTCIMHAHARAVAALAVIPQ